MSKVKVAIIGSGNIATDLMLKIMRTSKVLEMAVLVGIDPQSEGLARARRIGVAVTHKGLQGLLELPTFDQVRIVFDATSAKAHVLHDEVLRKLSKTIIDMTPAALGPYTVPVVNMESNLDEPNINMVSCGGQATIPIVAAVNSVAQVHYAEIIASISSKSAGPGTRANIDEFTATTALGVERVGGAAKGKAVIILNPAEPPLLMRNTVYALSDMADEDRIAAAVDQMVARVKAYVPGYQLKQAVQFERFGANSPLTIPGYGEFIGLKSSIFLQVEGAGHYLPAYAGNLDIMTSAALATGERLANLKLAA